MNLPRGGCGTRVSKRAQSDEVLVTFYDRGYLERTRVPLSVALTVLWSRGTTVYPLSARAYLALLFYPYHPYRSTTLNPPRGPNAGLRQNAACALESPLATCRRTETKRGVA